MYTVDRASKIYMDTFPSSSQWPQLQRYLRRGLRVSGATIAPLDIIWNDIIDSWPVDMTACKNFHPFHLLVTSVKLFEDALAECFWNYQSIWEHDLSFHYFLSVLMSEKLGVHPYWLLIRLMVSLAELGGRHILNVKILTPKRQDSPLQSFGGVDWYSLFWTKNSQKGWWSVCKMNLLPSIIQWNSVTA